MATNPKSAQTTLISKKHFGTPVAILGSNLPQTAVNARPVGEDIKEYLEKRNQRLLNDAQSSELELATAANQRDAARIRKEKDLIEEGKVDPEEDDMNGSSKAEDAAEIAATAVSNGVDPESAKKLATGKNKIIVVGPQVTPGQVNPAGGWLVVGGVPLKDPSGEYTFVQALQVAELSKKPVTEANTELSQLIQEIRTQNQNKQDAILVQLIETNKAILNKLNEPPKSSNEPPKPVTKTRIFVPDINSGSWNPVDYQEGEAIVLPPVPRPQPVGNNIAELAEKNRHEEKLAEISISNQVKQENRQLLADAVGSVTTIASAIATGMTNKDSGKGANPQPSNIEHMTCTAPGCGADIPYKPGAIRITCPKCNSVYIDQDQEPPAPPVQPGNSRPASRGNTPPSADLPVTGNPEG